MGYLSSVPPSPLHPLTPQPWVWVMETWPPRDGPLPSLTSLQTQLLALASPCQLWLPLLNPDPR